MPTIGYGVVAATNPWYGWWNTTSTSATTGYIQHWLQQAPITTNNVAVWTQWVDQVVTQQQMAQAQAAVQVVQRPITPEEAQQHREYWERTQAEAARQRDARAAREAQLAERLRVMTERREEAQTRAHGLLMSFLSPEQQEQLRTQRWFIVRGRSGRHYRVRCGGQIAHNVHRLDAKGEPELEICAYIGEPACPPADHHLAQLLWLRDDDEGYVRAANKWKLKRPEFIGPGVMVQ